MELRFWLSAFAFHVVMVGLTLVLLRRWRSVPDRPLLALTRDVATLLVAALPLAGLAALGGVPSGFTVLRLLSQVLFGELLLLLGWLAARLWLHRRWAGVVAATLGVGLLAVYVDAYHVEPHSLVVRRHALTLGPGDTRLRLLHLSDIQAAQVGEHERQALDAARELRPDLVVWTGDFAHPRLGGSREDIERELRPLLASLSAPLGVYAVRGDVDVHWPAVLEGTGIVPLDGQMARVELPGGRALALLGLSAAASRGFDRSAVDRLVRSAPIDALKIVIGHNPGFAELLADEPRVDLALAGHTHGGQVVLPLLGAPYAKMRLPLRYASGLHAYRGLPLHVSAGIGMERGSAPQIRFLCPPEICLIELRF
jgi:predicted MPP superfamily phosphohydrolase